MSAPSPAPAGGVPPGPEELRAEVRAFAEAIAPLPFAQALARYGDAMEGWVARRVGETPIACAAGCSACCHQPLLMGVVDLLRLYRAHRAELDSSAFARRLDRELAALQRFRRGAAGPRDVAVAQWKARHPCLFLDARGWCGVHEARPFLCRNAFSRTKCTVESLPTFGFPELADLARALRAEIHDRFRMERLDTPGVVARKAAFYLPEGLAWLVRTAPRKVIQEFL